MTVNLLRGTQIVATVRRELGLRSLGARGRNFALAGKRWVLRGDQRQRPSRLPRQWHEAAAAFVTDELDESRLQEASQCGALAVVHVAGQPDDAATKLRQLACFPAVAAAVIRGELATDFKRTQVAPNLLLAQAVRRGDTLTVRPWAQALWAESDDSLLLGRILSLAEMPVIAVRPLAAPVSLEQARLECDALQRDLATAGQFAGYVV